MQPILVFDLTIGHMDAKASLRLPCEILFE
jgi:hypothetical protein